MIERAPAFEIGVVISESGSLFNHLLLKMQFFMSFVPFMLFLFRLLESQPPIGVLQPHRNSNLDRHIDCIYPRREWKPKDDALHP